MKDRKITEREFSVPMLGGAILPIINESAELGYSLPMMGIVAAVSCFYAALRTWQKVMEFKYRAQAGQIAVGAGTVLKVEAVPAKPDTPPAVKP